MARAIQARARDRRYPASDQVHKDTAILTDKSRTLATVPNVNKMLRPALLEQTEAGGAL